MRRLFGADSLRSDNAGRNGTPPRCGGTKPFGVDSLRSDNAGRHDTPPRCGGCRELASPPRENGRSADERDR